MDVLDSLKDLLVQATVEKPHHYTGRVIMQAIAEIELLRAQLELSDAKLRHLQNLLMDGVE